MTIKKYYIIGLFFLSICVYLIHQTYSYNNGFKIFIMEKQKWESLKINNYQYSIKNNGDCYTFYFDKLISVKNGNFAEEKELENYIKMYNSLDKSTGDIINKVEEQYLNWRELQDYNKMKGYLSIDNIYSNIYEHYIRNEEYFIKGIIYKIKIEYDEIYHFPKIIKYSWIPNPFVTDLGSYIKYEITNFIIK